MAVLNHPWQNVAISDIRFLVGLVTKRKHNNDTSNYISEVHNMHVAVNDRTLNEQLETFWKLESFGASTNIPGLLWKNENVQLPNNRAVAEVQLKHLKRRLERNPTLKRKYLTILYLKFKLSNQNIVILPRDEVISPGISL